MQPNDTYYNEEYCAISDDYRAAEAIENVPNPREGKGPSEIGKQGVDKPTKYRKVRRKRNPPKRPKSRYDSGNYALPDITDTNSFNSLPNQSTAKSYFSYFKCQLPPNKKTTSILCAFVLMIAIGSTVAYFANPSNLDIQDGK